MEMIRDSIKFILKVIALIVVLLAGYAQKNQSNTPTEKGAVDLIMNNSVDKIETFQKVKSSKILSV